MSDHPGNWFHRRGQLAEGNWETVVDARIPGWEHTGLRVARLEQGDSVDLDMGGVECLVVPLTGSFSVDYREPRSAAQSTVALQGRESVFSGPTDLMYLSPGSAGVVSATSVGESRFLVATSPVDTQGGSDGPSSCYVSAEEVPVELRGAGASSRQVHNFGREGVLDALRLIVVEVITPAENWSSYPPHKHDEHLPGQESELEEIYYFEAAPSVDAPRTACQDHAFGLFSAYSSPAGEIEIDARVGTGDVALVPYGYHGPAAAAPGYDMYYLNVMAGPGPERTWLINDDPAYGWVRDTWNGQKMDVRLPFRGDRAAGSESKGTEQSE